MKQKNKKISLLKMMFQKNLISNEDYGRALIMAGQVLVNEQRIDKPGAMVAIESTIRIKDQSPFVSRGGSKLAGVIADLSLAPALKGSIVLDVGASTGGFTDCALQHGARFVYALDVGSNQLAWKLRQHPQVKSMEQTDIRSLETCIDGQISVIVADVSFTSLSNILPAILKAGPGNGVLHILLIKPQFEIDPTAVPEGGIVTDKKQQQQAIERVLKTLEGLGITEATTTASRVPGRNGNLEFFVVFKT